MTSCKKETETHVIKPIIQTRTVDPLDPYSIQWLEDFRINLADDESTNSYSVVDVEFGIESLYNIISTNGVRQISDSKLFTETYTLNVSNGQISKSNILNFFINTHADILNAFSVVSLTNKTITSVEINLESTTSTSATFTASAFITDSDVPNYNYQYNISCNSNEFNSNDCFRSGVGDKDNINDPEILWGGLCDSEDEGNTTSAQEEVQKKINASIPKYVKTKKGVEGYYKYVEEDCDIVVATTLEEHALNLGLCSVDFKDDLNFTTNPDLVYGNTDLNCAVCIIKDYINQNAPTGKVVSKVNIWGQLLLTPARIDWFVRVCYAKPIFISATVPTPTPTPLPDDDEMLNTSIFGIL